MSQKRNLSQRTVLAMAIAALPVVGASFGCQPAHFDTTSAGNPAATTPGTGNTTNANPGNTTGGANTGSPTAASQGIALNTTSRLAGAPLADATVTVTNLVTKAPITVTNLGAAGMKTDASGKFTGTINLAPKDVARITVTKDGKTLTTLVNGSGKALASAAAKSYTVLADDTTASQTGGETTTAGPGADVTNGGGGTGNGGSGSTGQSQDSTTAQPNVTILTLQIDTTSTALTSALQGLITALYAEGNGGSQAAFDLAASLSAALSAAIASGDGELKIALGTDVVTGLTQGSLLQSFLQSAGVLTEIQTTTSEALKGLNSSQLSSVSPASLSAINITLENGQLNIGGTIVPLPTDNTNNTNNTNNNLNGDNGQGGAENNGNLPTSTTSSNGTSTTTSVATGGSFSPTVSFSLSGSNHLSVMISQDPKEEDISRIDVRVPGTFQASSTIGSGNTDDPGIGNNGTLAITGSGSNTSWSGILERPQVTGGPFAASQLTVANVSVDVANGIAHLVMSNALSNEDTQPLNLGHNTMLSTTSLNGLTAGTTKVNYRISSVSGSFVEVSDAVLSAGP